MKIQDWNDVILMGAIVFVALAILKVIFWIHDVYQDSKENEKLFLSVEERQKLYNDTNGRIKPDRNAEVMQSIEHDCEYDVSDYDEEEYR